MPVPKPSKSLQIRIIIILAILVHRFLYVVTVETCLSSQQPNLLDHPPQGDTVSHHHSDVGYSSPMHEGNLAWMGDTWIPPHGSRVYSANDMRKFFSQFSVLFLGDSTLRRAYLTLYGILNATTTPDIDEAEVNVRVDLREVCDKWQNGDLLGPSFHQTTLCRPMPGSRKQRHQLDYIAAPCLSDVTTLLQRDVVKAHITQDYSLIVVSGGTWDTSAKQRNTCIPPQGTREYPRGVYERLHDTVQWLQQLHSGETAVVWRTAGFHATAQSESRVVLEINRQVRETIEAFQSANKNSNLTYVDWGRAILPRSFGDDRIAGDSDYHYGLKARLLFLQMLMNHLVARQTS